MNKNCDICCGEVDFQNGGAALMMVLCYDHSVTMSNMSYCKECYKAFVEKPLKKLNDKARLGIQTMEG